MRFLRLLLTLCLVVAAGPATASKWAVDTLQVRTAGNMRLVFNPKMYGAVGDGIALDRAAVDAAVAAAKLAGGELWFPPGRYRMGASDSWDVSGVARIDGISAVLDFTDGTANPIVVCNGTRTLIGAAVALAEGATQIPVTPGFDLPAGTPILLTSVEALPNPARAEYFKGERTYATAYGAGVLEVQPPLELSYGAAYVWTSNEVPLHIGRGVTFDFPRGAPVSGFVAKHADIVFEGTINGGGNSGLYVYASRLRTQGARVNDVFYEGTPSSYGIGVGDLSEADIVATEVKRARHCVDSGGGGYWTVGDSGGVGTGAAVYPSKYRIVGGLFVSAPGGANYALSAHGNNLEATVTGATVHGGVVFSGKRTRITGSFIYATDRAAFAIGSDIHVDRSNWGYVQIADTTFEKVGEAGLYGPIWVGGNPVELSMDNVTVRGPISAESGTYTRLLTLNGPKIDRIRLANSVFENTNMIQGVPRASTINFAKQLEIDNCSFTDGIIITPQEDAATIRIHKTKINTTSYMGMLISQKTATSHRVSQVELDGLVVEGAYQAGAWVTQARELVVRNSTLRNNGTGNIGSTADQVGLFTQDVDEIILEHNDFRDTQDTPTQKYGFFASGLDVGTVSYDLIMFDNDFRGTVFPVGYLLEGDATIVDSRGNMATLPVYTFSPQEGTWEVATSATIADHGDASASGTLAYALARGGPVIVLAPGTYTTLSSLTVPPTVTRIVGYGATINAPNAGYILMNVSPRDTPLAIEGVTFQAAIDRPYTTDDRLLYVLDSTNRVDVFNCTFIGGGDFSAAFENAAEVNFHHNEIKHHDSGVRFYGAGPWSITDNWIHSGRTPCNNIEFNIYVSQFNSPTSKEVNISNNRIQGTDGEGQCILAFGGDRMTVSDNIISGCQTGILTTVASGMGTMITGNSIMGLGQACGGRPEIGIFVSGFEVYEGDGAVIVANNIIHDAQYPDGTGIMISSVKNQSVIGNTIRNWQNTGLHIWSGEDARVENIFVMGNTIDGITDDISSDGTCIRVGSHAALGIDEISGVMRDNFLRNCQDFSYKFNIPAPNLYVWDDNIHYTPAAAFPQFVVFNGERHQQRVLSFTSGGPWEVKVGNQIQGKTSNASAYVTEVSLTSGSWAGGDAAGTMRLVEQTGAFLAEDIRIYGHEDGDILSNVATVLSDSVADTTPTVKGATHLYMSAPAPTTITNFADGEFVSAYRGQEVTAICGDTNITLAEQASGGKFQTMDNSNFTCSPRDTIRFRWDGTYWIEIGRSVVP